MRFNIKISEQDYIAFNKYYLHSSNVLKKTKNIVTFTLAGLCLVIIIMFFYFNSFDNLVVPIVESVIAGIFILAYIFYFRTVGINRSVNNTIKRMKKDGRLPFEENSEIEFTDEMIIDKSTITQTRLKYEDVEKIIKTEKYLFIFIDSARAIIVPLEQLNDKKNDVINLIETKVDAQKIIKIK